MVRTSGFKIYHSAAISLMHLPKVTDEELVCHLWVFINPKTKRNTVKQHLGPVFGQWHILYTTTVDFTSNSQDMIDFQL